MAGLVDMAQSLCRGKNSATIPKGEMPRENYRACILTDSEVLSTARCGADSNMPQGLVLSDPETANSECLPDWIRSKAPNYPETSFVD
jgi:hypothetical protein